jgi:hypothetical protein
MSFLTGSAPQANFSTNSTVDPTQSSIQQLLAGLLTGGTQPAGVQAYNGSFAAPTSALQNTSLAGLQQVAGAVPATGTPAQGSTAAAALPALQSAFGYTAPQVAAPTAGGAPQVVAPQINSAQAFQQGVAAPLIQAFDQQVLPSISGKAGGSAGGAYSSDTQLAKNMATTQLGQTLAQQGSLYDLGTQEANAANSLTAQTANQGATNQVDLANLAAMLGTNTTNTGASLTGQSDVLSALGETPSVVGAPDVPVANAANILNSTLVGGAVPQQTAQTQLTGQYTDYLNQISQAQTLLQLMAGFGTTPTQQTSAVASGGQTGLLQGVLSGLAGNSGAATALAPAIMSLFSDPLLKEDIVKVGNLDNKLPVYVFRYKGLPQVHMGLMADEVERVRPEAVGIGPGGFKTVNYALAALQEI